MADRLWYAGLDGKQAGPFSDEQLRELIARRQVTANTLVWTAPMPAWSKAADIPGLILGAAGALQPAMPGAAPGGPLSAQLGTFALFGRTLLVAICQFLIIPAPWAATSYYRWFVEHIRLPTAKPVRFEGRPGDIWYIFMLTALCGYGGFIHIGVQFLLLPLTSLFYLITIRWFFAKLNWEGRTAPLTFTGSYSGLLGWLAFAWISFVTIIGWAWVTTAMLRWMCRHVQGSSKQLSFEGSGWGVLWRTFALALCSVFIIPIPWIFGWYARWMIAQFHLSDRVVGAAVAVASGDQRHVA